MLSNSPKNALRAPPTQHPPHSGTNEDEHARIAQRRERLVREHDQEAHPRDGPAPDEDLPRLPRAQVRRHPRRQLRPQRARVLALPVPARRRGAGSGRVGVGIGVGVGLGELGRRLLLHRAFLLAGGHGSRGPQAGGGYDREYRQEIEDEDRGRGKDASGQTLGLTL